MPYWHESAMDLHVFPIPIPLPPPSPPDPSGSSQCTSPEHLSHASKLGWSSVSPLIVYLFQCYSLRTSHPRLLPQSPKLCSVHQSEFWVRSHSDNLEKSTFQDASRQVKWWQFSGVGLEELQTLFPPSSGCKADYFHSGHSCGTVNFQGYKGTGEMGIGLGQGKGQGSLFLLRFIRFLE